LQKIGRAEIIRQDAVFSAAAEGTFELRAP
jgi:hypothetical protein